MAEQTMSGPLVVVCDRDFESSGLAGLSAFFIQYQFVSDYPRDGFAAWSVSHTGDGAVFDVADDCRVLSAAFRQQALNRIFAHSLLTVRPRLAVIVGLTGCTGDLPRVASMMDVPTVLLLDEPASAPAALDAATLGWLQDAVGRCHQVLDMTGGAVHWPEQWGAVPVAGIVDAMRVVSGVLQDRPPPTYRFDYSTYEFCQRDHPLLVAMQAPDVAHFAGCETVLDLGCGAGIFLDCLRKQGITGLGVERDPRIAEYGRGMGLDIITDDALKFLARDTRQFDGIYCSHFVEHLPFDMLQGLFEGLADRLRPGGVLVLVFPDPESIRSQLLGFWRDPEHVRFYHPELVTALANSVGLELDWSSHQAQPHKVVSFAEQPPAVAPFETTTSPAPLHSEPAGLVEKLLYSLGFVHRRQLERLQAAVQSSLEALHQAGQEQVQALSTLEKRTDTLWDVNLTWAWSDNATMRLKKRASHAGEQA